MKNTIIIRSGGDRLRHSFLFEALLLTILAPAGAYFLERPMVDVGLLAVVLSLKAMLFNLIYNWVFDLLDARAGRNPTKRSVAGRLVHALGFECGLVLTSLPLVIWWLDLTVWHALAMDFSVTSFVVVYTFVFGWGYDRLFPLPQVPAPRGA